jgi:tRNA(Ile)-lysidine synthase
MQYNNIPKLLSPYKQIFIAYSGGVDSHVLLHLLSAVFDDKKNVKLIAIHINHNISPNAKKWSTHCARICKKLKIKYISKNIPRGIKQNKESLEEFLRNRRYEIFAKILPANSCLVTAHHADDQAETLLLQLFRGAGPKGLSAMSEKIKFGKGWLVRPLLDLSRKDILLYAKKHRLKWIEDESNVNIKFDRNFVRHNLVPLIQKRWPSIINTLNRVAKHCWEATELLNIQAREDWQRVLIKNDPAILDVTLLKKLSLVRQKNLLRFWLHLQNLPMPSEVKLMEVIRTVINSRYDAMPVVKWFGAEVRRFRNDLYAMLPMSANLKKLSPVALNKIKANLAQDLKLDPKKIKIKFRAACGKVKVKGRLGRHDLKKLMQEWGMPPWMRAKVPLVFYEDELIAAQFNPNDLGECRVFSQKQ